MSEVSSSNQQASQPKDRFRKVEAPAFTLLTCRLCGSPAELWQRWRRDDVWDSFGACTNVEDIDGEACHFHLPDSEDFYRDRKTDAVRYWNTIMGVRAHETSPALTEALCYEGEKDYQIDQLLDYLHYDPDTRSHPDWVARAQTAEAELAKWKSACTGRHGSQMPCVPPEEPTQPRCEHLPEKPVTTNTGYVYVCEACNHTRFVSYRDSVKTTACACQVDQRTGALIGDPCPACSPLNGKGDGT